MDITYIYKYIKAISSNLFSLATSVIICIKSFLIFFNLPDLNLSKHWINCISQS